MMLSRVLQEQIEQAINLLRNGGVIAFPTETVYGLAASIAIPQAVRKIYAIKGRNSIKALPLVLSRSSQLAAVARAIPENARLLVDAFWPGPLTLVVYKSAAVPDIITAGKDMVAVRVSPHPVAVALVEGLGTPVTGTSANLSGQKSPVCAEEVRAQIGDRVDMIIDGGKCPGGIESTIVDVTGDIPVILREGAIKRETIEMVCRVK